MDNPRLENYLKSTGIEFRRGLSGGGNQPRWPHLQNRKGIRVLKLAQIWNMWIKFLVYWDCREISHYQIA